jgi:hypothetical protein
MSQAALRFQGQTAYQDYGAARRAIRLNARGS